MKPAIPAAVSRWPMLVLTDPRAQNCVLSVWARNAWVSAATSIGSPISVPVPWHSMKPIVSGSTSATAIASPIAAACPSTLGAR